MASFLRLGAFGALSEARNKQRARQQEQAAMQQQAEDRRLAMEDRTRRQSLEDLLRGQKTEEYEYEVSQRPLEERLKQAQINATNASATQRSQPSLRASIPTEGERKASAFYTSGKQGYETLENVLASGKGVPSWWARQAAKVGMGAGNVITNDEYRQMRQSALQLSDAWLRYTSGAAVPEQEVERFAAQFIPEPGDDEKTLQQKSESRKSIMLALKRATGRALPPEMEQQDDIESGLPNREY